MNSYVSSLPVTQSSGDALAAPQSRKIFPILVRGPACGFFLRLLDSTFSFVARFLRQAAGQAYCSDNNQQARDDKVGENKSVRRVYSAQQFHTHSDVSEQDCVNDKSELSPAHA